MSLELGGGQTYRTEAREKEVTRKVRVQDEYRFASFAKPQYLQIALLPRHRVVFVEPAASIVDPPSPGADNGAAARAQARVARSQPPRSPTKPPRLLSTSDGRSAGGRLPLQTSEVDV